MSIKKTFTNHASERIIERVDEFNNNGDRKITYDYIKDKVSNDIDNVPYQNNNEFKRKIKTPDVLIKYVAKYINPSVVRIISITGIKFFRYEKLPSYSNNKNMKHVKDKQQVLRKQNLNYRQQKELYYLDELNKDEKCDYIDYKFKK